jgi:hypothetical protein
MNAARDDYVDEVAVERACAGDRSITLNRAEMAAAVALHQRRGLSLHESADLLGPPWRSIQRIRSGDTELPYSRPGATVDNTREKITTALKSEFAPVRRAAAKANQALATLDTVLAEWDAKEAALERVRELEAALAEAKAALKTPTKPPAAPGEHKQARAWARQQGIEVPDIGRVPVSVLDAWRQATTTAA